MGGRSVDKAREASKVRFYSVNKCGKHYKGGYSERLKQCSG